MEGTFVGCGVVAGWFEEVCEGFESCVCGLFLWGDLVVVEFEGDVDWGAWVAFGCFVPFAYAVGEFVYVV